MRGASTGYQVEGETNDKRQTTKKNEKPSEIFFLMIYLLHSGLAWRVLAWLDLVRSI